MKYLFIGGHNDGKRVELHEPLPKICLPIYPKRSNRIDEPFEDYKTEIFEAIPFEANGGRFWIYAISGMSPYQALQALIERYPDPAAPVPETDTMPPDLR